MVLQSTQAQQNGAGSQKVQVAMRERRERFDKFFQKEASSLTVSETTPATECSTSTPGESSLDGRITEHPRSESGPYPIPEQLRTSSVPPSKKSNDIFRPVRNEGINLRYSASFQDTCGYENENRDLRLTRSNEDKSHADRERIRRRRKASSSKKSKGIHSARQAHPSRSKTNQTKAGKNDPKSELPTEQLSKIVQSKSFDEHQTRQSHVIPRMGLPFAPSLDSAFPSNFDHRSVTELRNQKATRKAGSIVDKNNLHKQMMELLQCTGNSARLQIAEEQRGCRITINHERYKAKDISSLSLADEADRQELLRRLQRDLEAEATTPKLRHSEDTTPGSISSTIDPEISDESSSELTTTTETTSQTLLTVNVVDDEDCDVSCLTMPKFQPDEDLRLYSARPFILSACSTKSQNNFSSVLPAKQHPETPRQQRQPISQAKRSCEGRTNRKRRRRRHRSVPAHGGLYDLACHSGLTQQKIESQSSFTVTTSSLSKLPIHALTGAIVRESKADTRCGAYNSVYLAKSCGRRRRKFLIPFFDKVLYAIAEDESGS